MVALVCIHQKDFFFFLCNIMFIWFSQVMNVIIYVFIIGSYSY